MRAARAIYLLLMALFAHVAIGQEGRGSEWLDGRPIYWPIGSETVLAGDRVAGRAALGHLGCGEVETIVRGPGGQLQRRTGPDVLWTAYAEGQYELRLVSGERSAGGCRAGMLERTFVVKVNGSEEGRRGQGAERGEAGTSVNPRGQAQMQVDASIVRTGDMQGAPLRIKVKGAVRGLQPGDGVERMWLEVAGKAVPLRPGQWTSTVIPTAGAHVAVVHARSQRGSEGSQSFELQVPASQDYGCRVVRQQIGDRPEEVFRMDARGLAGAIRRYTWHVDGEDQAQREGVLVLARSDRKRLIEATAVTEGGVACYGKAE